MLLHKQVITGTGTLRENFEQQIRTHKSKYIIQGTIFIICGVLAVALPGVTALHAELLIGMVLLVSGIFQLVLTLKSKMHWWSILSALLSIIVGTVMVWKPFAGLLAIVTLFAVFMTLEGLFELMLSWRFRPLRHWSWMLFSGIATLILAVILWIGFPAFDVLYLGWVIAANLILYGLSLLMLVWKITA